MEPVATVAATHQLEVDGQLEVWQSKYFLGRLSEGNRKRQVIKSLIRAGALQPDKWTLVTPMVPTPEERDWLRGLQPGYSFSLVWESGDWLDRHLAEHPAIVRFFMSANEEYVALLRELRQEQEALVDGLPAARDRFESLTAKVAAADPFYSVSLSIDAGRVASVSLPRSTLAQKSIVQSRLVSHLCAGQSQQMLRWCRRWKRPSLGANKSFCLRPTCETS